MSPASGKHHRWRNCLEVILRFLRFTPVTESKPVILSSGKLFNPKKPNENNLVFLDPTVDFDFSFLSGTKVINQHENNKSTAAQKY